MLVELGTISESVDTSKLLDAESFYLVTDLDAPFFGT